MKHCVIIAHAQCYCYKDNCGPDQTTECKHRREREYLALIRFLKQKVTFDHLQMSQLSEQLTVDFITSCCLWYWLIICIKLRISCANVTVSDINSSIVIRGWSIMCDNKIILHSNHIILCFATISMDDIQSGSCEFAEDFIVQTKLQLISKIEYIFCHMELVADPGTTGGRGLQRLTNFLIWHIIQIIQVFNNWN